MPWTETPMVPVPVQAREICKINLVQSFNLSNSDLKQKELEDVPGGVGSGGPDRSAHCCAEVHTVYTAMVYIESSELRQRRPGSMDTPHVHD